VPVTGLDRLRCYSQESNGRLDDAEGCEGKEAVKASRDIPYPPAKHKVNTD